MNCFLYRPGDQANPTERNTKFKNNIFVLLALSTDSKRLDRNKIYQLFGLLATLNVNIFWKLTNITSGLLGMGVEEQNWVK